jgi:hypothetical protein
VLFLVLNSLVRATEPRLLKLDERLDEIQVTLMTSSPPEIHDEIVDILRILTELVQALTWYGSDLDDVATTFEQLPGMRRASAELFTRHRERVSRMRESARDYRDEAKDAIGQYASNTSNRQGQLINVLTVLATFFLPLTFLTGFFGMNFGDRQRLELHLGLRGARPPAARGQRGVHPAGLPTAAAPVRGQAPRRVRTAPLSRGSAGQPFLPRFRTMLNSTGWQERRRR